MRILQVINWLEFGGAERLIYYFTKHVNQVHPDVDVEICTLIREGALGKIMREEGNKVMNLEVPKWDFIRGIRELRRLIRTGEYDVVHAHLFPTSYYVGAALGLSRPALSVYTEHSAWNRRRDKPYFKPIEAFIFNRFDTIIANSEESRQKFLSWLPGIRDKIIVVENGVPPPTESKRDLEISDPPSLLVIGRLVRQKGIDIAIEAVRVMKDQGQPVSLSIVGEGPDREMFEEQARDLDVKFHGGQENPEHFMATHDLLLVPSRREGFGLSPVEGMMVGIPVVASDVDALSRVIIDGRTGLHFRPGDIPDLVEKIRILLTDEILRKQLVSRARKWALEKWSIDRYANDLLERYRGGLS